MDKTMNELQTDFNQDTNRLSKSSRPFFRKEYYSNMIESKLEKLRIIYRNWDTTPNKEYEVWYCHRMILLSQRALSKLGQ